MVCFAAGALVSLGVGILLTRTSIPAMVAVDEVALVVPSSHPAPAVAAPSRPATVSDFNQGRGTLLGNIIESRTPGAAPAHALIEPRTLPEKLPIANISTVSFPAPSKFASDPNVRWFNARPARPARTIWMTVTGYSPDARSCGDSADGLTATMHSVTTNAMKLVAADPTILPYGSMVSIPGYDEESIVPVLDCGGAIKGDKIDLLFPTHEEALQWGRQRILVTIWEYADGLPAEDPRKLR